MLKSSQVKLGRNHWSNAFHFLLFSLLFSSSGLAAEKHGFDVDVSLAAINAWLIEIENEQSEEVSCRKISEMEKTVVCVYPSTDSADRSLERAALWVEGNYGHAPSTMSELNSLSVELYRAGGHNRSSKDLLEFYLASMDACDSKNNCLTADEQSFFSDLFFPLREEMGLDFYVITLTPSSRWHVVLTHELWHAQYFEDVEYQDLILGFWQSVTSEQRGRIRLLTIGDDGYYGSVEHVLLDEFQAYCKQMESSFYRPEFQPDCMDLHNFIWSKGYQGLDFNGFLYSGGLGEMQPTLGQKYPSGGGILQQRGLKQGEYPSGELLLQGEEINPGQYPPNGEALREEISKPSQRYPSVGESDPASPKRKGQ